MDVKIVVSHRLGVDADVVDNPIYLNIRGGAVLSNDNHDDLQGDDTGENISERINSLCEFTSLYWAWKNLNADYFGLCHYRRYLSFAEKDLKFGKYLKQADINSLSKANQHLLRIDDENYMKSVIAKYDMIVPYEYDSVTDWIGDRRMTLKEQWLHENKNYLTEEDFELLLRLIKKHAPQYYDPMVEFMNGHCFRGFNCFVMKKELFNEFCEFVFPILIEFDDALDKSELSEWQLRAPGFAGEWLFSLWTHVKEHESGIRTKQVQLVRVKDAIRQRKLEPRFEDGIPPFVYIEREDNISNLAVSIESLISSKHGKDKLDIIILQKCISTDSWEWHLRHDNDMIIQEMAKGRRDISIRFYNPKHDIGKINVSQLMKGIDEEEYYNALIPWILHEYDKAVLMSDNVFFKESPVEWYLKLIDGVYHGWGCTRNLKDNHDKKNVNLPESDTVVCNLERIRSKYNKNSIIDTLVHMELTKTFLDVCYKEDIDYIDDNGIFRDEYSVGAIKEGIPAKYYKYIPKYDDAYIIKVRDVKDIAISQGTRAEKYYWTLARNTVFYNDLFSEWVENNYGRNWFGRGLQKVRKDSIMEARSDEQIIADALFPRESMRRKIVNKIIPRGSKQWNSIKRITKKIVK